MFCDVWVYVVGVGHSRVYIGSSPGSLIFRLVGLILESL